MRDASRPQNIFEWVVYLFFMTIIISASAPIFLFCWISDKLDYRRK